MTEELKKNIETIAIGKLPVGCLKAAKFRIPEYQRGYRWKTNDVIMLLDDLMEFIDEVKNETKETDEKKKSEEKARLFYCLQPLVVKKSEKYPSEWEVVDGQQRLTTLFLIWKAINDEPPYTLSYDTRELSKEFLKSPKAMQDEKGQLKRQPNIDFHHIYHAHKAILTWFNSDECKKTCFKKLLSDSTSDGRNVRFIWYQLQEGEDAVAAFTRLNVGKIPLTDEELIRALFLSSNKSSQVADQAFQHRLALEWDRMETALQEPDFWGFLSHETPPEGGRIRLLFQLCAPPPPKEKDKDHYLFTYYHERLTGKTETPADVWKEIIACFGQLEEWYRDPELFHLVGFRTSILGGDATKTLRMLLDEVNKKAKMDFAISLRNRIRKEFIGEAATVTVKAFVSELNFDTKIKTRQTLALFNIATILRNKGVVMRFPFHLYHGENWDIEHIQSQAGDRMAGEAQTLWLKACKNEIEHEVRLNPSENSESEERKKDKAKPLDSLLAVIDEFKKENSTLDLQRLEKEIRTYFREKETELADELLSAIEEYSKQNSTQTFVDLEKKIRQYFMEEDDKKNDLHSIGNLTLLDASTNRSYGNAPFVVKRTKILEAERAGTFILTCTRDLLLKVFSKNPGNLRRWDIEKDGAAHEAAIRATLETFFGEKGGTE
jgi:hypothetical protein